MRELYGTVYMRKDITLMQILVPDTHKKVRQAQVAQYNYILVVGAKEVEEVQLMFVLGIIRFMVQCLWKSCWSNLPSSR